MAANVGSLSPTVDTIGGYVFLPLWSGALAIGHRPALRTIKALRAARVSHIATVLSRGEQAEQIGEAARAAGLEWTWIELGSTKNLPKQRNPEIVHALSDLTRRLRSGARIYLHCSAGIHRTGMIAAALLFHNEYNEEDARAALEVLRPITARDMGEERFRWARSFAPDALTSDS
ncbi:MAG: protein-tyrosine phosphatase family protein [Hyphomonadaceae bacterium]